MTSAAVCVCAFRRPAIVDTLRSLAAQVLPGDVALRVVVAENDDTPALRTLIERTARDLGLPLHYRHAPGRNISIARNACLEAALEPGPDGTRADVMLFIDDDEIAEPDWVARMVAAWRATGAGVVFGPAHAEYPPGAPAWMRVNAFHSNIPVSNCGVVETGHSCNALLDLSDPRMGTTRFDTAFGRTGGEDVDFFFRLHRSGVRMTITDDAVVREPVARARMSLGWLLRRSRTVGALYGACASVDGSRRLGLMGQGAAKAAYCGLRALAAAPRPDRAAFWLMRGAFHAGVVSGCIAPPRQANYGAVPS
ncbi:glycosyltransferase family 2 protein [Jannaschia sp. W003]|uniref:glycosyltransferase n=1 Tax=Jannaschia sp. W003 TaxID=2867012 RepID=UPI0021A30092|nr:glycosyltransferase [Jannaschia sp. W003]UWQ21581.1 glycosyltransferase [Jannaschia sp. W003]